MEKFAFKSRRAKPKKPRIRRILSNLSQQLWDFRWRIVIALVFLFLAKIATILIPITIKGIIDWLNPSLHPDGIYLIPVFFIIAYAFLNLASILFEELRDAAFSRVLLKSDRRIGLRIFEHLHQLSHAFHQNRKTGDISHNIEKGTHAIDSLVRNTVCNILPTLFEITVICLFLLVMFDFKFVFIAASTVLIYFLFTNYVTRWRAKFRDLKFEAEARADATSVDSLLNHETVKYYCNEAHEYEKFDAHLQDREKHSQVSDQYRGMLNIGQGAIVAFGTIALLYFAGIGVTTEALTLGDFIMLNAFLIQMYLPLRYLGTNFRETNQALTDVERMYDLLDVTTKIPERTDAPDLEISNVTIEFSSVVFSFTNGQELLKNVSFEVPSGQKVALVGRKKSGKSALVKLLFRFYDVESGGISIDGTDIRDVSVQSLRSSIGVVPQKTVLFNASIEYNIRYGAPDCSHSEFMEAVKKVKLKELIESLPDRYDTIIGEDGITLSERDQLRISIARAILRDPPIFVFDEPQFFHDSDTEKLIDEIAKNRTLLIIAERLSTIADADMIYVLEEGEIVESGNHWDLLDLHGLFSDLWWYQQVGETAEAKLAELMELSSQERH